MTKFSRRPFFIVLAAIPALLALAPPARADQNVNAMPINAGLVGEQDFDTGYVVISRVPVFWQSDVPWRLTVTSLDPNLGVSRDAKVTKPLSDLQWRMSDAHAWQPMGQDPEELAWNNNTGSGTVYIDIKVLLNWLKDPPGEYHADLIFTIEPL